MTELITLILILGPILIFAALIHLCFKHPDKLQFFLKKIVLPVALFFLAFGTINYFRHDYEFVVVNRKDFTHEGTTYHNIDIYSFNKSTGELKQLQ